MLDLPNDSIERLRLLESEMVACATGGPQESKSYEFLRREFCADTHIKSRLPDFVRFHRSLQSFWSYIQPKFETYKERRTYIYSAFTPAFDFLEGQQSALIDPKSPELFESFDANGIHRAWLKAVDRRSSDPEGAITVARTLLEAVLYKILDDLGESCNSKDDLPKLYFRVSKLLNLAPSEHSHEAIKSILGGAASVVGGLGSLRNKLSDAHAEGVRLPVRPTERHAKLAVDMAGVMATFLVETHLEQLDGS